MTSSASPSNATRTVPAHDSLASSVSLMFALTVFQRLVGFVRGIMFCRFLPPEALGEWDLAFGFLMLAAPLAVLGLPGSFGRYLPRFAQAGKLRTFVRRATAISAGCAALVITGLVLFPDIAGQWVLGRGDCTFTLYVVAGTLAIVIVHHYLESLFAALRCYRVVSNMHLIQSLLFAVLGGILLAYWSPSATSVVAAYGVASAVSVGRGLWWLKQNPLHDSGGQAGGHAGGAAAASPDSHFTVWRALLIYAGWMWTTNLIANLFQVVDRYMVLHYSNLPVNAALAAVGDYHSSRVVPILLVSLAGLLSTMLLPYLSHDWEAGARAQVSQKLNFCLKLCALGLLAGGITVLASGPLLFHGLLGGKYAGGQQILPLTLVYCTWYAILMVAQNYLFCRERAGFASGALLLGLLVNVVINLLLVPTYGVVGAVLGTVIANFCTLAFTYAASAALGMKIHSGTLLLSFAPACLGLGLNASLATGVAILFFALRGEVVFTRDEQATLRGALNQLKNRLPFARRARTP